MQLSFNLKTEWILEDLTDPELFQRLCCDLLTREPGYKGLIPGGSPPDLGIDAELVQFRHKKNQKDLIIVQVSLERNWKNKLNKEYDKVMLLKPLRYVFITNQKISVKTRKKYEETFEKKIKIPIQILDRDWLRTKLDSTSTDLRDKYLRAGLELSERTRLEPYFQEIEQILRSPIRQFDRIKMLRKVYDEYSAQKFFHYELPDLIYPQVQYQLTYDWKGLCETIHKMEILNISRSIVSYDTLEFGGVVPWQAEDCHVKCCSLDTEDNLKYRLIKDEPNRKEIKFYFSRPLAPSDSERVSIKTYWPFPSKLTGVRSNPFLIDCLCGVMQIIIKFPRNLDVTQPRLFEVEDEWGKQLDSNVVQIRRSKKFIILKSSHIVPRFRPWLSRRIDFNIALKLHYVN